MDHNRMESSGFLWVRYWVDTLDQKLGISSILLVVSSEGFDFASLSPVPDFVLEPAHVIKAICFDIFECFVDSSRRANTSTITLQFGTVFSSNFLTGFGPFDRALTRDHARK